MNKQIHYLFETDSMSEVKKKDLLLLAKFWSAHLMDTLLSQEATRGDLWMEVKWHNYHCRLHEDDNVADVLCQIIHTT